MIKNFIVFFTILTVVYLICLPTRAETPRPVIAQYEGYLGSLETNRELIRFLDKNERDIVSLKLTMNASSDNEFRDGQWFKSANLSKDTVIIWTECDQELLSKSKTLGCTGIILRLKFNNTESSYYHAHSYNKLHGYWSVNPITAMYQGNRIIELTGVSIIEAKTLEALRNK